MSDEAALLAAIRDNPDEDTPRLVYADWLDDQGGEANVARAEYIRLEIAHARDFPETRWSKAKEDARKRARVLFARHYREWFPELYGRKNLLHGARGSPDMRRGFPYRLLCDAGKLLDVGERLMQLAPVGEVEFRDLADAGLSRLVAAPWVRGFRDLNLSGYSDAPDWAPLAAGPYFTELVELVPYAGYLHPAGAARIAAANPFPNLRRFSVSFRVTDDGLAALFGGSAFISLRDLSLSSPGGRNLGYGPGGVRAVCDSQSLAGLKSFDLRWRPVPELTAMLTGATFWPGLEELDLLRNNLGNDDLARMLNAPGALRRLKFADNLVTAEGARTLAEHRAFAQMTMLDLSGNPLGDAGVAALANSPGARTLVQLAVSGCKFGLAGVTALAESPHLTNLRELSLHSNAIDLKCARALASSPHLGGLKRLYMGSGKLTAAARKSLKERFGAAVSF